MSSDPRRQLVALGNKLAAEHLTRLDLRLLDRNFLTRWGELDIVACDSHTIVFCEVKTRIGSYAEPSPLDSIRIRKRPQVRRMAARWLAERQNRPRVENLRFDAIDITLDHRGRLVRLEHVMDAF
jgi:putative endonuclease